MRRRYDKAVTDINMQDLKPVQQEIKVCCNVSGNIADFKRDLAKAILKDMPIFDELKSVIFK